MVSMAIPTFLCYPNILICGYFSKTAAAAEAIVAMAPPLGMATARTSMAIAGGSGDDMAIDGTGAR